MSRGKLVRPRQGKRLAGVCKGLADFYDISVTRIRWTFVVTGLFGPGEVAYIALWIMVPKAP